jgi:hypothetical protein
MTDDRFDELMKDAAGTFRRPIEPPLEEMWQEIEARAFGATSDARRATRGSWLGSRWMHVAATLVIGVAIGRASTVVGRHTDASTEAPKVVAVAPVAQPRADSLAVDAPYQDATNKYLGQTAALLIALPSEVKAGHAAQFVDRAGQLLTTTRVLLDSPVAHDQAMRSLLEDLELVLAQVVRLQNDRSHTGLDFINQALQQRDVIPRLRTAVADISAN